MTVAACSTFPVNLEPLMVATTPSFTATVNVEFAPASVEIKPVPGVKTLSFERNPVLASVKYCGVERLAIALDAETKLAVADVVKLLICELIVLNEDVVDRITFATELETCTSEELKTGDNERTYVEFAPASVATIGSETLKARSFAKKPEFVKVRYEGTDRFAIAFDAETFNVLIVETSDADVTEILFDADKKLAVADVVMLAICDVCKFTVVLIAAIVLTRLADVALMELDADKKDAVALISTLAMRDVRTLNEAVVLVVKFDT